MLARLVVVYVDCGCYLVCGFAGDFGFLWFGVVWLVWCLVVLCIWFVLRLSGLGSTLVCLVAYFGSGLLGCV